MYNFFIKTYIIDPCKFLNLYKQKKKNFTAEKLYDYFTPIKFRFLTIFFNYIYFILLYIIYAQITINHLYLLYNFCFKKLTFIKITIILVGESENIF